ncbi:MAG: DUF1573 domain-containing protein [Candidatus Paceibacterota bacterium]|jgi:hypothetical protein
MKTKTIIIGAVIVLGILGLMWWGWGNQTAEVSKDYGAASALLASEKLYDFGSISMKDGNVTKEFTVTNSTAKDIAVKTILTSCMCTEAFIVKSDGSTKGPFGMSGHGGFVPPANEIIGAGESRIIRVVFDPNAHGPAGVGSINRYITLTDSDGSALQIEIKALVTP